MQGAIHNEKKNRTTNKVNASHSCTFYFDDLTQDKDHKEKANIC